MESLGDIISSLSESDIEMLKKTASSILGSQQDNNSKQIQQVNSQPENSKNTDLALPLNTSELQMIMKAKQIFEQMNKHSSSNTNLINALKPFLSAEEREKADKAARMLQIFEMLPLLKDLF